MANAAHGEAGLAVGQLEQPSRPILTGQVPVGSYAPASNTGPRVAVPGTALDSLRPDRRSWQFGHPALRIAGRIDAAQNVLPTCPITLSAY